MGMPFFVPGWHGSFGPAGPGTQVGAYAIRPYLGTRPNFAGVRRRPYAIRPYMGTRHFLYPAKFAGVRRRPFLLCFLILFLPPFSVTPSRTVPPAA